MNPTTTPQEFVYVIHAEGTNRVKIGRTKDIASRLRDLRTASPFPLRLIELYPASRKLETIMHRKLKQYRRSGEWFLIGSHSLQLPHIPGHKWSRTKSRVKLWKRQPSLSSSGKRSSKSELIAVYSVEAVIRATGIGLLPAGIIQSLHAEPMV